MKLETSVWDEQKQAKEEKLNTMSKCIISQIKENSLNVYQALVLLDMVKTEISKCTLA